MLGTGVGSVHKQRQGTGLATILPGSESLKDFIRLDDQEGAAKAMAAKQKAAAQQDARQKMLKFNPERWLKHEVELGSMQEKWIDEGANLMNAGVNPDNGTDAASVAWRKKQAQIQAYSEASMQVKELHKVTRGKIEGSEADKYDPESIKAIQDYFDTPISKIVEDGILPPTLVQRKPTANLQKSWVGLVSDLQARTGQGEFADPDRWAFIQQSIANAPDLQEAANSYFANLPQIAQDDYKARAQANGKSIQELIHYDFMKRYEKGREPFDLNKFIQQGADSIDVPYTQTQTPSGFGTYVDKKELGQIAGEKALIMLTSSPEALQTYESILPMRENEAEGEYRQRAIADLSKRLQGLKSTKTVSGVTDRGQDGKDQDDSANRWLRDLRSPDAQLNTEAAGYLYQAKDVNGMYIRDASVVDIPGNPLTGGPGFGRNLVINLEGKPTLKEVREKILDEIGAPDNVEYKTEGTNGQIIIPITDTSENALLKFHDKAFKDTKRKYSGPITTRTVEDIMSGSSNRNKF